jgi:hypothetical protein
MKDQLNAILAGNVPDPLSAYRKLIAPTLASHPVTSVEALKEDQRFNIHHLLLLKFCDYEGSPCWHETLSEVWGENLICAWEEAQKSELHASFLANFDVTKIKR